MAGLLPVGQIEYFGIPENRELHPQVQKLKTFFARTGAIACIGDKYEHNLIFEYNPLVNIILKGGSPTDKTVTIVPRKGSSIVKQISDLTDAELLKLTEQISSTVTRALPPAGAGGAGFRSPLFDYMRMGFFPRGLGSVVVETAKEKEAREAALATQREVEKAAADAEEAEMAEMIAQREALEIARQAELEDLLARKKALEVAREAELHAQLEAAAAQAQDTRRDRMTQLLLGSLTEQNPAFMEMLTGSGAGVPHVGAGSPALHVQVIDYPHYIKKDKESLNKTLSDRGYRLLFTDVSAQPDIRKSLLDFAPFSVVIFLGSEPGKITVVVRNKETAELLENVRYKDITELQNAITSKIS